MAIISPLLSMTAYDRTTTNNASPLKYNGRYLKMLLVLIMTLLKVGSTWGATLILAALRKSQLNKKGVILK
jgi:cyclopropane fatty-acyl-phospholipid synthase-like methyltransferase